MYIETKFLCFFLVNLPGDWQCSESTLLEWCLQYRLTNFYILTSAGQKGIKTTGLNVILLSVILKYHFSMEKVMFSCLETQEISKADCSSFPGYSSASQACSLEALCTLQWQRTLCPTGSDTGHDSSQGTHEVHNFVRFDYKVVTVVLQSYTWKTALLS